MPPGWLLRRRSPSAPISATAVKDAGSHPADQSPIHGEERDPARQHPAAAAESLLNWIRNSRMPRRSQRPIRDRGATLARRAESRDPRLIRVEYASRTSAAKEDCVLLHHRLPSFYIL